MEAAPPALMVSGTEPALRTPVGKPVATFHQIMSLRAESAPPLWS
jgi:hypothetical protein